MGQQKGPARRGEAGVLLAIGPGLNSNPDRERQALLDFGLYRKLRLAEVDNPATRFDCGRIGQVEWAFDNFCRSFQRLCTVNRMGAAL